MTAVTQLGYLVFEVSDLEAWEAFATKVLGLMLAERRADGGLAFRLDSRAQRIQVIPGSSDDVAAVGWEVADDAAMAAVAERLNVAGFPTSPGTEAEARDRKVEALVRFRDPAGAPCELYYGAERATEPFASRRVPSGFVAEEQGLGHAVMSTRDKAASLAFYQDVLGLRRSDDIVCELMGHSIDVSFMHAPADAGGGRHHSVAVGGPMPHHIHHFMLEVGSLDDVGMALDRALRGGIRIAQTLGKHPNDRMVSFYGHTPSGFQFELGWGGVVVDDRSWEPSVHGRISEWGHLPPRALLPRAPRPPTGPDKGPDTGSRT